MVISVVCEEFKPESYRGVYAKGIKNENYCFINTGSFMDDYKVLNKVMDILGSTEVYHSSSVDNFVKDSKTSLEESGLTHVRYNC